MSGSGQRQAALVMMQMIRVKVERLIFDNDLSAFIAPTSTIELELHLQALNTVRYDINKCLQRQHRKRQVGPAAATCVDPCRNEAQQRYQPTYLLSHELGRGGEMAKQLLILLKAELLIYLLDTRSPSSAD